MGGLEGWRVGGLEGGSARSAAQLPSGSARQPTAAVPRGMENRAPARRCMEKLLQQVEKSTGGNLRFL